MTAIRRFLADRVRRWSLKTRILLLVVVLLVAGIWGLAARTAAVLQEDLEQLLSEQLSATVGHIAADLDLKIQLRIDALKELAAAITPDLQSNPAAVQRLLAQRNIPTTLFPTGVFVANGKGTNIADYPKVPGRAGGFIGDRDYFREIMAGRKQYMSTPVAGRFSKQPVVSLSVPLHDASGGITGALVAAAYPSDPVLFGQIEQTPIGKGGRLLVASPRDRVWVSANNPSLIMQPLPAKGLNPVFDRRMEEGFEGATVSITSYGVQVLGVSRNMKTTGWVVIGSIPTSEAFAPIAALKRQIYLTALLITLAIALVLRFVLKRQLAPLEEASAAMGRMTDGGEPLAPLPVVQDDEIGRLLGNFNRLVAERIRLDELLRKEIAEHKFSEEISVNLAAIVESTNDAIVSRSLDGTIRTWNKAAERLFGWPAAEAIGQPITILVPPERRGEMRPLIERVMRGETLEPVESLHRRRDGSLINTSVTFSPIRDAAGKIVSISFIYRDITERKRMEAALRESEAWFSAAFEQAAMGMALRDIDPHKPHWQRVNQKLCDILGYTREELQQLTSLDLTPPEDRPTAIGYNERLRRGETESYSREKRYVRKDGRTIWVRLSMSAVRGVDGRPTHVLSVIEDISARIAADAERQKSEARFRDLFEFSPDAILMVNREGRIALANRKAETMFGYSREELLNLPVEQLVPTAARQAHAGTRERFYSAAIPRSMGAAHPDLQAQRKDGTTFPVDISLNPIRTDDHMLVVTTVRDITDRKSLETQLRQAQKMEAIGTLAGGIAHDFNNILAAISGNAELVRQDIGAQHPALVSLDEIRKASQRAKDLVGRILAYSRQQPQSRQPMVLAPVVMEVVNLLRATLPTGIDIAMHSTDDTLQVLADPTQIHQVLLNLGTNAWHALEHGKGCIDISLEGITLDARTVFSGLQPGRHAHVTVSDTGRGMNAAALERAFEPFFTTKAVGEGTGLGLSVVHGIMQTHQGIVRIESAPGRGTTVHLYFPAIEAPARTNAPEPAIPSAPRGHGQHVLYLDDEEALVLLVTRMLQRMGYRVSGYTSAQEALQAVRARPHEFDLVVTDYNMPVLSGLDVVRELTRIRPDLPVIIASGYITSELRQQAGQAGVRHLVYKPNTVEELCEAVDRLIGNTCRQPGTTP